MSYIEKDSVIQEYKLEDAEGLMYIGNDKGNYWCLDLYNLISGFDEYYLLYALDTDEERKRHY